MNEWMEEGKNERKKEIMEERKKEERKQERKKVYILLFRNIEHIRKVWTGTVNLTLVLPKPDILYLCKHCRSNTDQLTFETIWICTVCQLECDFVSTTWIK